MSKRKPIRTKRDNTDTSLDTSSKPKFNLFPRVLRGKKIELINEELHARLEDYLKTEDPKHLFKAIKQDAYCLQGRGLTQDDLTYHFDSTEIDVHTVVWVTIEYWQDICFFKLGTEEVIDEAKRLLGNIGNALILENKAYYEIECGNYFSHKIPTYQGDDRSINYENAKEFTDYWNKIESIFESNLKNRYKGVDQPYIEEFFKDDDSGRAILHRMFTEPGKKAADIKKAIETKLGDKISETTVQHEFKINSIPNITASYIAWKNENNCSLCKENAKKRKLKANKKGKKHAKVAYKTILNLHDRAIEELNT
ncbi:hypothetical protein MYX76_03655 [Desulfobacterota bacterium AH_259_B03_O07]|nr:hypothetical protein [Desulfobacterota bacterium AH_259_B03_O07]